MQPSPETGIALRGLSVRTEERVLLSDIDLDLPDAGLIGLVGPMGSGKSTLLRFLCGRNLPEGMSASCNRAECRGAPLAPDNCPALIAQRPREEALDPEDSARLLALRCRLIEDAAGAPGAICTDEPSSGLFDDHGRELMRGLAGLAQDRLVLVASHNLDHLRGLCSRIVLLGGGRIVADCPAERFYAGAAGSLAAHFLRTGGLTLPRLDAPPHSLAPEQRPAPRDFAAGLLPTGSTGWILPDRLMIGPAETPGTFDLIYRLSGRTLHVVRGPEVLTRHSIAGFDEARQASAALNGDLERNRRILLEIGPDPGALAAFLGAFLIGRGVAPAAVMPALAACLPDADLDPAFEAWLWDLDLLYALGAQ